ncbi:WD40 repeat domain-containing protein [bacterium CPR1]|nr:WD40 repeat domain-containing protein [bacterium CPR1]
MMVTALAFFGPLLAAGHEDGRVRLWPVSGGSVREWSLGATVEALFSHQDALWALTEGRLAALDGPMLEVDPAFVMLSHRGEELLLAGPERAALYVYDGVWRRQADFSLRGPVEDVDLAPDGRLLLAVRERKQVDIYDRGGQLISSWTRPRCQELAARFAPGGNKRVAAGLRGSYDLQLLDSRSGRPQREHWRGSAWLGPVAVSSDGERLVARDRGDELRVYDLVAGRVLYYGQPELDPSSAHTLAGMSRVPAAVAPVGPGRARVSRWVRPGLSEGTITALAVGGDRVAGGTRRGVVFLGDVGSGAMERLEEGGRTLLAPPGGEIILTAGVRGTGWNAPLLHVLEPRGQLLSLNIDDGTLRRWPRPLKVSAPPRDPYHPYARLCLRQERAYLFEALPKGRDGGQLSVFELGSGRRLEQRALPGWRLVELEDGSSWLAWHRDHQAVLSRFHFDSLECSEERVLPWLWSLGELWAGGMRVLLRPNQDGHSPAVYDVASGETCALGGAHHTVLYPSLDGLHFGVGNSEEWTVYQGFQPVVSGRQPPLGGHAVFLPEDDLLISSCPSTGRIRAHHLDGRPRAELMGHAELIVGILPSSDRSFVTTWDRAGVFRRWRLEGAGH